jgi:hypothetical protein
VYTSSELPTLAQQWNITNDELTRASNRKDSDFADTSNLPFDTDSIATMIGEVLQILD